MHDSKSFDIDSYHTFLMFSRANYITPRRLSSLFLSMSEQDRELPVTFPVPPDLVSRFISED